MFVKGVTLTGRWGRSDDTSQPTSSNPSILTTLTYVQCFVGHGGRQVGLRNYSNDSSCDKVFFKSLKIDKDNLNLCSPSKCQQS